MAAIFSAQLDFIFFFYGLAFILLGSVCFTIARGAKNRTPWLWLGTFALLHGVGEWLDLLALIVSDTPAFAMLRTGGMTVSFMILLEFARLEAVRLGFRVPGRWVHLPLLLLVALGGYLSGLNGVNAFARYAFGFTGAMASAAVMAFHAKRSSSAEKRWIAAAVGCFALYGLAAGAVVPPVAFWSGDFFNYDDFAHLTGTPIQLVRGVLACLMAFSIWGFWGQRLMREVASPRYSRFMRRQFVWTLVTMGAILMSGWVLTEYLGGIYRQNVQEQALGDLDLVASRLDGETSGVDGMVRVLAGSDSVVASLQDGDRTQIGRIFSALSLGSEVAGARDGYVLDRAGVVVAAYRNSERSDGENFAGMRFFRQSLAGQAGNQFAVGAGKERDYYASYPVRGAAGAVVGVAVLRKSLDVFDADIKRFDRSIYLVDRHGIVIVTNRPDMQFRPLWPPTPDAHKAPSSQYGSLGAVPLLAQEPQASSWVSMAGSRNYVQRRPIAGTDWSIVTAMASQGIYASRVLGIIITLQMATLALVYLVGRERWIHDNVQQQKRLDLEELARNLDYTAATDPLTGLFNRRKFNREMAVEMLRSQRYHTPLSLVLFDLDGFKAVNDTYGHQAGDNVLTEISRLAAAQIRATDVLARWGGEEFVILTPGCTADMAANLAANLGATIRARVFDPVGKVTCSFGVAQLEHHDTADTLIARVDEALYRAKMGGRDRVEVAPAVESAPGLVPAG